MKTLKEILFLFVFLMLLAYMSVRFGDVSGLDSLVANSFFGKVFNRRGRRGVAFKTATSFGSSNSTLPRLRMTRFAKLHPHSGSGVRC